MELLSDENLPSAREKLISGILAHRDELRDKTIYNGAAKDCRANGLGQLVTEYEKGLSHEDFPAAAKKARDKKLIYSLVRKNQALNRFTGASFTGMIEEFARIDRELSEITRREIFCRLAVNLPSPTDSITFGRQLNILRRAITSNGRGLSIRNLFDQIPDILGRLCPCMLMSPISVAQYLAADYKPFDLVVFDEASQLPTCKAVGVLARGNDAVIVGDPNQMPPTSFFAGSTVDEDNLDIEDLESILDDCLALGMPETHLKWHYRSRHESLIAFSNREFYENRMLTFPSANDRERRVTLTRVSGFFDRAHTRQNPAEAHAIVKEIVRRYRDPKAKNRTIGVVTFNISQQALVEDLLQEDFRKDPGMETWALQGEEPLFVKNLENVQGDERDVILFSVAFGPDPEGRITLNFGPINKEGGWRRLNVAVTRARQEMKVFATLKPEDIDLSRTASRGAEALKAFLEYAERGKLPWYGGDTRKKRSGGIAGTIVRALEKAGYRCHTEVGHSDFRVDIAVENPARPEEYLMGILLDGESYGKTPYARDREISQPSILEGLGWTLYRVWTMDWWDNPDKELARLMEELSARKERAVEEERLREARERAEARREAILALRNEFLRNAAIARLSMTPPGDVEELPPEQAWGVAWEDGPERKPIDFALTPEDIAAAGAAGESGTTGDSGTGKTESGLGEKPGQGQKPVPEPGPDPEPAGKAVPWKQDIYLFAELPLTSMTSTEFSFGAFDTVLLGKVRTILAAEAPVMRDTLAKRLFKSCGLSRPAQAAQSAVDRFLRTLKVPVTKQGKAAVCWRDEAQRADFKTFRIPEGEEKRSAEEYPLEEVRNGICLVLSARGAADRETIVRETARLMGYARSGPAIAARIGDAIAFAGEEGLIAADLMGNYRIISADVSAGKGETLP